jgi:hypothetical protein
MVDLTSTFRLPMPQVISSRVDNHIEKQVSALRGHFINQETYTNLLSYIPMMTTGGVSAHTVAECFSTGVVAVGAGSALCPPQFTREGKFDNLTLRAEELVQLVKCQSLEIQY